MIINCFPDAELYPSPFGIISLFNFHGVFVILQMGNQSQRELRCSGPIVKILIAGALM